MTESIHCSFYFARLVLVRGHGTVAFEQRRAAEFASLQARTGEISQTLAKMLGLYNFKSMECKMQKIPGTSQSS